MLRSMKPTSRLGPTPSLTDRILTACPTSSCRNWSSAPTRRCFLLIIFYIPHIALYRLYRCSDAAEGGPSGAIATNTLFPLWPRPTFICSNNIGGKASKAISEGIFCLLVFFLFCVFFPIVSYDGIARQSHFKRRPFTTFVKSLYE